MRRIRRHWRVLLRPICWVRGHDGRMTHSVGFVSEDAVKPASTYCARCRKLAVSAPFDAWSAV